MSKDKIDSQAAMQAAFVPPSQADRPLVVEVLEAYRTGALSPQDEARVQAYLLRSPESVQRLLWLEAPERRSLAATEMPARATEVVWEQLRRQIPAPHRTAPRRLTVLAASVALTILTAVGWLLHSQWLLHRVADLEDRPLERPRLVADVPVLYPERPTRGGATPSRQARVPADAGTFVLALDVSDHSQVTDFSLHLLSAAGEQMISVRPKGPDELGHLVVLFSRGSLPAGEYRLEVRGATAAGIRTLEVVELRLE